MTPRVKITMAHIPLHIAASVGHLPVVRLLVEDYHCDPGIKDKSGLTPAQWAEKEGHTDISAYFSSIENTVSSDVYTSSSAADLQRTLEDQLKPYIKNATPTGGVLGSGTYGSVIELELSWRGLWLEKSSKSLHLHSRQ